MASGRPAEMPPGAPGGIVLPGGTPENPLAIGLSATPPVVTLPMSHVRQVSVANLELSQRSTTPVTVVSEVDVSRLKTAHDTMKPNFEQTTGIPLTYTAYFVRATVKALQAFPIMNATLTAQGHIIPRYIHLGFAVQTPTGVYIPNIWNAQSKSVGDIAHDLHVQGQRARAGQIPLQEMSGHTFVITNTGTFGKTLFGTPTIKPPNVGILSFETIQKRPVVDEYDQIVVKPMMYMALSADHRAVDGADMIGFIGKVKEYLETLNL
jgi:2-oxoglutarate dehydrogenase E2 component (dihydrolipoamide succinyltransferase)